ncbi:hypothetical protein [Pseudoalteromonas xiamenensis]
MFKFTKIAAQPVINGLLALDVDTNATRVLVQDRFSLAVLWHSAVASTQLKITTPTQYSIDANLLVTIFDDQNNFNAECVDHVKADIPENA